MARWGWPFTLVILVAVAALPPSIPVAILADPVATQDIPLGVFFLHLRKCGGSSVGAFIRAWLSASGCCPSHAPCKAAPAFMASADNAALWSCRGEGGNRTIHFREDEYHCMARPTALVGMRLLSVIVVRHPIDRHISQWWYHGGPGHRRLLESVASECGVSPSRVPPSAASTAASTAAAKKKPRFFEGLLERTGVKGSACYAAALESTLALSVSEGAGARWWTEDWLDKDPPRAHLFRSLHAQYLPNYMIRRLAAEPLEYKDARAAAADAAADAAAEATVGGGASGSAVVSALASRRQRCNLRGARAIGEADYGQALSSLEAFDVVLVMEWLSETRGATRGGTRGGGNGDDEQIEGPWSPAAAMAAVLQRALGPNAPPTLTHQRPGISAARGTRRSGGEGAPFEESRPEGGAWGLGGRGDAWRGRSAPPSILARLNDENALDMRLYARAAALARGRALLLRPSPG